MLGAPRRSWPASWAPSISEVEAAGTFVQDSQLGGRQSCNMRPYDPIVIANGLEPFDFHQFAPFNDDSFAVYRGTGVEASDWELHRDTDEWLLLLQGSVTVEILTDQDQHLVPLVAGQLTVVPRGCWHRHTKIVDVVELYYTPGTSEESSEADPRQHSH